MKIFLVAGHTKDKDPGALSGATSEHEVISQLLSQLVLQLHDEDVQLVPVDLTLEEKIAFVNKHASAHDVVLSFHMNAAGADASGIEGYFHEKRPQEKALLEQVLVDLSAMLRLPNRGAKADSTTRHKQLGIIRGTTPTSYLIELGFISNEADLLSIKTRGVQTLAQVLHKYFHTRISDPMKLLLLQAERLLEQTKQLHQEWTEWDDQFDRQRGQDLANIKHLPLDGRRLETHVIKTLAYENNRLLDSLKTYTSKRAKWIAKMKRLLSVRSFFSIRS